MTNSKIEFYEKEYLAFNPVKHVYVRIKEMEAKSDYGVAVAKKWTEITNDFLVKETYPVVHPIGQETFSLYAEYPSGVFEYALDIDGATSLIKDRKIAPVKYVPANIFEAVDLGNINTDLSRVRPNHKNPVMVIQSQYLTGGKPYCINGNHRIFEANRNNEEQIEVYVFKDMEFVPFFYDLLSKAMYFLEIDYDNVISGKTNYLNDGQEAFAFAFK